MISRRRLLYFCLEAIINNLQSFYRSLIKDIKEKKNTQRYTSQSSNIYSYFYEAVLPFFTVTISNFNSLRISHIGFKKETNCWIVIIFILKTFYPYTTLIQFLRFSFLLLDIKTFDLLISYKTKSHIPN